MRNGEKKGLPFLSIRSIGFVRKRRGVWTSLLPSQFVRFIVDSFSPVDGTLEFL